MRPDVLNPFFASVASLPRIGPKTVRALAHLLKTAPEEGDPRLIDLLCHWPDRLIDRTARPNIADAPPGELATLEVTVLAHEPAMGGRRPHKVRVGDESGELALVFFRASPRYLAMQLPIGEQRFVSGRVEVFAGTRQIVHPDYILSTEQFAEMPLIEPVYPLTAGISNRVIAGAVRSALAGLPDLPEWLDRALVAERGWPSFTEALRRVHAPDAAGDLDPAAPARERLAFDELAANQLALALLRRTRRRKTGRAITAKGALAARARAVLPFSLTGDQEAAIAEVLADLAGRDQMMRLLQGDVGSGKTLVAAMAMLNVCEAGAQTALMAPTEMLARQHHQTLSPLFAAAGVEIALLTGREQGETRAQILSGLATGEIAAVVGTHALFQNEVAFRDLAFVVIDEQHRFGVHQRLALQAKASKGPADLLVMTATPIPRTLVLTHYGNMDVTRIAERPPGRGRIDTRAMPLDRVGEVVDRLAARLDDGARVYWICPQIDEDGEERAAAALSRFNALAERFGPGVALAHGRQRPGERDAAMAAFRDGAASILVATTVVEVGVDVPQANIIVIEQAERFGLSQLHQLRGRVARGGQDGACVLLYASPLGSIAARRLDIMRESDDGFRIAEEDLALRGGGEVLGTRQSGLPDFRVVDPIAHAPLIEVARDQAELILKRNLALDGPEGEAVRMLLYVFERDDAIRLADAG